MKKMKKIFSIIVIYLITTTAFTQEKEIKCQEITKNFYKNNGFEKNHNCHTIRKMIDRMSISSD